MWNVHIQLYLYIYYFTRVLHCKSISNKSQTEHTLISYNQSDTLIRNVELSSRTFATEPVFIVLIGTDWYE